jgi:predicted dehydrogenase
MYRVGIVGAGFGVRVHLPAYVAHPGFEVVALASPHNAERVAAERNIPHAFRSCEEMLQGCDLDVVSIAAPPFTHHADVLASLKAGKHVVCEKPFALNVGEAEEMVAAAEQSGRATAVMHEFRWIPQRQALKELIVNRHLEPLREFEITQLSGFLRLGATRKRGWWFQRAKGGGIAGALMSHIIDTANWYVGRPPVRSTGYLRTANPVRHDAEGEFTSDVDDGAFAILDYGEGLIARLALDGTTRVESSTDALHAENRTAVASGADVYNMRLFSVDDEETSELDCQAMVYQRMQSVDKHVPMVMELLDEFVKQIETGNSAVPTFKDALETQRVLESIGYSTSSLGVS